MELSDRFKYIMKLNQLSASAFAEEIGVQRSSVSHVLSGRNKPSLEFIQKVLKRFPKVDANWLVNGTTSVEKEQFETTNDVNHRQTDKRIEEKKEESLKEDQETTQDSKQEEGRSIKKVLVFYSDGTFEEFVNS